MLLDWIHIAQEAGARASNEPSPLSMIYFILPMVLIFWFMIVAPNRRQEKERKAMLDALSKNDKVITAGGIHGTITKVKEHTVLVKVSDKPELVLEVLRTSVGRVEKSGDGKKDDAETEKN